MKLNKLYLRPFNFVSKDIGRLLKKKKLALSIKSADRYFTHLEILHRDLSSKNEILDVTQIEEKIFTNKILKNYLENITLSNEFKINNKLVFKKKKFLIFGILNLTPDSFSDGGEFNSTDLGYKQAIKMNDLGADVIDVGGESTRPGAKKVSADKEILRILPVVQKLIKKKISVSLDTRNSSTMKFGVVSGVSILNDVSALKNDKKSIDVLKDSNLPIILMHMPGNPKNMMDFKDKSKDILLDIFDFLEERIKFCELNGIKKSRIIVDPGIGFGKSTIENLQIIKNISIFHSLGCPIMLGVSRKSIISKITKSDAIQRIGGSISFALHSLNQGVQIFRVHDVLETKQAIAVWERLES